MREDQNIVIRADDVELDLFDEDEVLLDRVNENCKRGDKYVVKLVRKDMNPDLEFILGLDVAENSTAKAAKGNITLQYPTLFRLARRLRSVKSVLKHGAQEKSFYHGSKEK